jgi:O-acetyl-ADP-ribose deacetylase (regulator of RNase III)
MKPVIMMDFDGACANKISDPILKTRYGRRPFVDPVLIKRTSAFADAVNAEIVICSAWRRELSLDTVKDLIGPELSGRLHRDWKTASGGVDEHRGNEVLDWIQGHASPRHVIFDDDRDFYSFQPLVRTNPWKGITDDDIEKAHIKIQKPSEPVGGMQLRYGDLMYAPIKMIVHGCNAQGAMNSGVAKAVRDKYPDNYSTYRKAHQNVGLKLGDVVWHHHRIDSWNQSLIEKPYFFDPGRIIGNVITQQLYGREPGKRYVDYSAVRVGLGKVARRAKSRYKLREVGLPLIGCGLANGSCNIISEIIQTVGVEEGVRFTVVINDKTQYNQFKSGEVKNVAA